MRGLDTATVVRSIPETLPLAREIPADSRRAHGRHVVVNYHEIAAGRFRDVPVAIEALSMLSTYPVIVILDGQPFVPDTDVTPISNAGTIGPATFQPSFSAGAFTDALLRPCTSFVVRRTIRRISLQLAGDISDYEAGTVHGAVHLFFGSGDTDSLGFGLPVSHMAGVNNPIGGAPMTATLALDMNLHNDVSPVSALFWIPSRTEANGIFVRPGWSGAAGLIEEVNIRSGPSANPFTHVTYFPGVANWDFDFGVPLELCPWSLIDWNGTGIALRVRVVATAGLNNLNIGLRCKSWL